MAKLQFDVTAKWQEVEKLRQEVEALKSALKDFNAAGDMKAFDEMNKKYAEATGKLKEYEQQMQKYQQIIEQMKLSSGIVDESRQITAELNNATDMFVEQRVQVKALESDIRKLQNEYTKLSDVQRNSTRGEILLNEIKEMESLYRQQNEVLKQLRPPVPSRPRGEFREQSCKANPRTKRANKRSRASNWTFPAQRGQLRLILEWIGNVRPASSKGTPGNGNGIQYLLSCYIQQSSNAYG